jgi:hypothetical protein
MKTLNIKAKELRCVDTMPLGMLFDLAEAMDSDDMMKGMAAMGRTIRNLVVPEDRKALSAILNDATDPLSFDDLNTALGGLLKQYGDRPLGKPSSSPVGRGRTGGSSKVVSLHRATGKAEPKSPRGGASRAS